jgi:hypothetical protein
MIRFSVGEDGMVEIIEGSCKINLVGFRIPLLTLQNENRLANYLADYHVDRDTAKPIYDAWKNTEKGRINV